VTAFINFGDRRFNSSQVNSSQVLNWLPLLDDLKQTTTRILNHARTAESLANEQDEAAILDPAPSLDKSTTSMPSKSPSQPLQAEFGPPFSSSRNCPVATASSPVQAGHFSPLFGYGLLSKTSQVDATDEFLSRYFVSLNFLKDCPFFCLDSGQGFEAMSNESWNNIPPRSY